MYVCMDAHVNMYVHTCAGMSMCKCPLWTSELVYTELQICTCSYMSARRRTRTWTCTCNCTHISINKCVRVQMRIFACICEFRGMCTCTCMGVLVRVGVRVCVCAYVFIWVFASVTCTCVCRRILVCFILCMVPSAWLFPPIYLRFVTAASTNETPSLLGFMAGIIFVFCFFRSH